MKPNAKMFRRLAVLACTGALLAPGLSSRLVAADDAPAPASERARSSTSVAPRAQASWDTVPLPPAVHKGLKWLIVSQHPNGGWSQDGGRAKTSSSAPGRSRAAAKRGAPAPDVPDVGNTALAALAIFATGTTPSRGTFQGPLGRAVMYILGHVEGASEKGLAITDRTGTQLQGKIGRYADTFLAARVLIRADGKMRKTRQNDRVRSAVKKILAKIEAGQADDGSWNAEGGWAPIHSTAYASQALWEAKQSGHDVDSKVLDKVERFTERQMRVTLRPPPAPKRPKARKARSGKGPVVTPSPLPVGGRDAAGAAGVVLYSVSQGIEQLTRTPKARKRYLRQINQIRARVNSEQVLKGLGSMGGEEFISYTNINLAMARLGGESAQQWNEEITDRLTGLQNADGSWSGHHCITGRTAVTGLALTTLLAERSVPRRD